jgi:Tol biopolymer transport system component
VTVFNFSPNPLTSGKNTRVSSMRVISQSGTRPSYNSDGTLIAYDYQLGSGYYQVRVADTNGNTVTELTNGNPLIPQRSNGNAVWAPSGSWIAFESEVPQHVSDSTPSDPGIGTYMNLWAAASNGSAFYQLTNVLVGQGGDGIQPWGVCNPRFSRDGTYIMWTEYYLNDALSVSWGRWRIRYAQWDVSLGFPRLLNPRVLYQPSIGQVTSTHATLTGSLTSTNNYIAAMDMFTPPGGTSSTKVLLAQNTSDMAYSMDQCLLDLPTGVLTNLSNSGGSWEEASRMIPPGFTAFAFMSNQDSTYTIDYGNPNWPGQPKTREWYRMNTDGSGLERLTYFNDNTAPEYTGFPTSAVNLDISPDGLHIVGTIGLDFLGAPVQIGHWEQALKLVRIDFTSAL